MTSSIAVRVRFDLSAWWKALAGLIIALSLLVWTSAASAATTIVVKPSALNGWGFLAEGPSGSASSGAFVAGPAATPLGSGSARLTVDSNGRHVLGTLAHAGTPFSQISRLEYSTYRSTPDAGNNLAISLQFNVDYDLTDANLNWQGRLVFEPYQTAGGTVTQNTWQTWNALTGKWWATGVPGNAVCPQSLPCTWAQVLATFPNAGLSAGTGALLFRAGGPWAGGFDGNVDALTIGVSGNETTYDFEPETACTTVCYVNAVAGNDAFGGDTPASAKKTIQAAIDQVDPNGEVRVFPGDYSETATNRFVLGVNGPHQFGLFIAKDGVSVVGVDGGDNLISDYNAVAANVATNATNNFGFSGIFIEGDGVTLSGLRILPNISGDNKTIEIIGDDFTLQHSHIDVPGGGSVYFNDWQYDAGTDTSHIQSYTIEGNHLDHGTSIDLTSGAGFSGLPTSRLIQNNTFTGDGVVDTFWPLISFSGSGTPVPWFVYSVGGAVIENNRFSGAAQYIRARGDYDNNQFNWATYWNNNTYDRAVVAGLTPPGDLRDFTYTSGSFTFNNVRRIGAVIQAEIDIAVAGDTVLVKAGYYPESPRVHESVSLIGESGAAATTIQLQNGPTYLGALTIDAPTVTIAGFTIRGFDAVGIGLASTNILLNTTAENVTIQDNRIHVGAIGSGSNGDDGFGLLTTYTESSGVNQLVVEYNVFQPLAAAGGRAFYINPGVDQFVFRHNAITGRFTRSALTQAKDGLVEENTLTGDGAPPNRSAGFATWGYPNPSVYGHTVFRRNTITGTARGISLHDPQNVTIENNFFLDTGHAVWLGPAGSPSPFDVTTVHINQNSIVNSDAEGVFKVGTIAGIPDAKLNWWNYASGPSGAGSGSGEPVSAGVDYDPWLCTDTDTEPATPGFQPALVIDCAGPVTTNVQLAPNPAVINSAVMLTALVDDTATGGSDIASAAYTVDGGSPVSLSPADGTFDEVSEGVQAMVVAPAAPGVYQVCVSGTDDGGATGAAACVLLVVYDPNGGFVTGGGWINSPLGACQDSTLCQDVSGRANFGFVSRYRRGASVPDGNTEFVFQAGGLNFRSTSYDWLVVNQAGTNAQFKGTGQINGGGLYKFMIWAGDGAPDTFRIRIWTDTGSGEHVIYDNGVQQALGGGSIIVHKSR